MNIVRGGCTNPVPAPEWQPDSAGSDHAWRSEGEVGPGNPAALWGAALGIVGLILAWVLLAVGAPMVGGLVTGLAGLLLSVMGLRRSRVLPDQTGRTWVLVGVTLNTLVLVSCALGLLLSLL